MTEILIAGVGSILRGDDGIGPRVVDGLRKSPISPNVRLYSGDVSGLDLLKYFPENGKALIVDAADMGEKPGTVRIFPSKDMKKYWRGDILSTHGMSTMETIIMAEKLGIGCDIFIAGIQPENVSFGLNLSDTLLASMPVIVRAILDFLVVRDKVI
jgi:hydrogenase maturation protease